MGIIILFITVETLLEDFFKRVKTLVFYRKISMLERKLVESKRFNKKLKYKMMKY